MLTIYYEFLNTPFLLFTTVKIDMQMLMFNDCISELLLNLLLYSIRNEINDFINCHESKYTEFFEESIAD